MLSVRLRLPPETRPTLPVSALVGEDAAELVLKVLAGARGTSRRISTYRIQKPGLSLTGLLEALHPGRIQLLGRTEISFLKREKPAARAKIIKSLCRKGVPCLILTKKLKPPRELLEVAEQRRIPLLQTPRQSSTTIADLERFLEERLAPHLSLHGVLIDIYGLGVLLLGDSGVGKSECALDLIVRGHRLVSDDIVVIKRKAGSLNGSSPELTRYHMELRGLGIINIKDLFGVSAVRYTKDIDLAIRLEPWKASRAYDRLGIDERTVRMLGLTIPFITLPVALGRNLSVLIEVAARNALLRRKGYAPARELTERLRRQISQGATAAPPGSPEENPA